MKNPLRDMSRPKALGLAGLAAGALTVSAAAAALNVGLLSPTLEPAFVPSPVAQSGQVVRETTTTQAPVEVVYQDVYEHVSASAVPAASTPVPAPAVSAGGSDGSALSDADEIESEVGESEDGEIESEGDETGHDSDEDEDDGSEDDSDEAEDDSSEDDGGFDD